MPNSVNKVSSTCQLITFANSLDPVQYRKNVGSGLDTDHLTLE